MDDVLRALDAERPWPGDGRGAGAQARCWAVGTGTVAAVDRLAGGGGNDVDALVQLCPPPVDPPRPIGWGAVEGTLGMGAVPTTAKTFSGSPTPWAPPTPGASP